MPAYPPSRRRFLRQSATAAGSLLLPAWLGCDSGARGKTDSGTSEADSSASAKTPSDRPFGVAILGLGDYAGTQIAPALQLTNHCRLVGLITGSPDKLPAWQAKYSIADAHCYTYDTMARVADDPAIDVIYVITPTATHKGFAVKAAQTGKHVWCEKPLAMTAADCQTVIDACDAAGVRLAMGYRMLHEPNTRRFIEVAQAKPFGPIASAQADAGIHYLNHRNGPAVGDWRGERSMGGGALYDMGVYAINALRHGTQLMPEAVVRATQRLQTHPDGADLATEFTLRFPGGVEAAVRTSFVDDYNRCRIDCARGWYEMAPLQPYVGAQGKTSDGRVFDVPVANQQALQMDDDALAIMNGTPLLAPGREGLIDVAVVETVLASVATGREVAVGV